MWELELCCLNIVIDLNQLHTSILQIFRQCSQMQKCLPNFGVTKIKSELFISDAFRNFTSAKKILRVLFLFKARGWCIKFATGLNGHFTSISSHCLANQIHIFHKTEVQTVILRCWTGLYFISFMPQIQKMKETKENAKSMKNIIQMSVFLQNRKNQETEIIVFCVITFDPSTI